MARKTSEYPIGTWGWSVDMGFEDSPWAVDIRTPDQKETIAFPSPRGAHALARALADNYGATRRFNRRLDRRGYLIYSIPNNRVRIVARPLTRPDCDERSAAKESRTMPRTQGRYYSIDADRLAIVADLAGMSADYALSILGDDWAEGQEHQDWLDTANPKEIADWLITIASDN